MIYRKQSDFDDFSCIADSCPMSCCLGWQIVIDDKSLERYKQYSGSLRERLDCGIDYHNSCFRQIGSRCAMLLDSGLCSLQSAAGEEILCDTCRLYPRHIEEFPGIREYSISLSCPEAVRILMNNSSHLSFNETEDDAEDEYDDYQDFDYYLFDKLCFARMRFLDILQKGNTIEEEMDNISYAAYTLQKLYDEGDIAAMDEVDYTAFPPRTDKSRYGYAPHISPYLPTCCRDESLYGYACSYEYMMESLELLMELEELYPSWKAVLTRTRDYWAGCSASSDAWKNAMYPDEHLTFIYEKILESLLYTYFCGSIYDGEIYARAMIPVMTVRWIMMISQADNGLSLEETICLFSRETEHSDENLNALIRRFEAEL